MRITYLARVKNNESSGVNKKISNQIREWRKKGHTVKPIFITNSNKLPVELASLDAELIVQKSFFSKTLKCTHLEKSLRCLKSDIIYLRMSNLPLLSLNKLFKFKVVLEINTRVFEELKVSYKGIRYLFLKVYFKYILRKASGFIGVTTECLIGLPKNVPSTQVGNSINLDKSRFIEALNDRSSDICVFVGSPGCPWHGVDRLLQVAKSNSDNEFWIIGYRAGDMEDIWNEPLPLNVKFFGPLSGKEYEDLLKKGRIAFGSLAMDRNNMTYSSSLKNRDYLQYALPIIMQGEDSDIVDLECVSSLPKDFSIDEVNDKLIKLKNSNFFETEEAFSVIEQSISSDNIEERRLDFFKKIINSF